ncbi:MAG: hypothetical protein E7287_08260 [Lachnospiraceae bacterium]|nr:hypothetical protein [Lachnospiraceae bacterium]
MEYVTAYFWHPQSNACSLLLQQAEERRGYQIVLACICEESTSKTDYLIEALRDWLCHEVLTGQKNPQKRLRALAKRIPAIISRAERNKEETPLCGILCIDRYFCIFARECGIQIFNTCFGRAHAEEFLFKKEINIQLGELESGVGILLSSSGLRDKTDKQRTLECLMVQEILDNSGAERHLKEMCTQAQSEGATNIAAVLLLSK